MAAGIGAFVGPLVGGWLYKNIAGEAPFYVNWILLTISLVILGVYMKEPHVARVVFTWLEKQHIHK